jgi:hypothetical protein
MKKLLVVILVFSGLMLTSCGDHTNTSGAAVDSLHTGNTDGTDSAANNGVLPPSGAPGNANNSSLADTTYKTKDSTHKK